MKMLKSFAPCWPCSASRQAYALSTAGKRYSSMARVPPQRHCQWSRLVHSRYRSTVPLTQCLCRLIVSKKSIRWPIWSSRSIPPALPRAVSLHKRFEQPTQYATRLMKLVRLVKADSWADCGGRGKVEYYPNGHALVVYQTPEVQQCVADLLSSLRKLQDKQVVIEIRFVRTSPELLERFGMAMPGQPVPVPNVIRSIDATGVERIGVDFAAPPPMAPKTCVWTDKQVRTFLEAVQGDRRTNVMQSPKLTVFNGQTAHIVCGETKQVVTSVKVEECKGRKLYIPVNECGVPRHALRSAGRREGELQGNHAAFQGGHLGRDWPDRAASGCFDGPTGSAARPTRHRLFRSRSTFRSRRSKKWKWPVRRPYRVSTRS